MRKKTHVSLLATLALFTATSTIAQTVQFPEFSVPIYRYAKDQRYSEHQKIIYVADINEQAGAALFPNKSKQYNRNAFIKSVLEEMSKSGIKMVDKEEDLVVAIDV